jgi:hypothetical protein
MTSEDTVPKGEPRTLKQIAIDRSDLIKRLFAVTISVGCATQMSRLIFDSKFAVSEHQFALVSMLLDRWQGIVLLAVSMATVIGSWDGYLAAIERRPLEDRLRFYLDIVIVFAYLFLMLSSQFFALWFSLLVSVFVLYVAWDLGSIAYSRGKEGRGNSGPLFAWSIVITLIWLTMLVLLTFVKSLDSTAGFAFASLAALAIVTLYRMDKLGRWRWRRKIVAVLAVCLLILASRLSR